VSPEERLNRLLRFVSGEDEKPSWMHQQSGWAQSGVLFTYQRGNPVKCLVEKFDRAAVFTVQIGLNVGEGGFPVQAQATVVWSINGTPVRRVVSVSQGVSISGVTESAQVDVYDVTQQHGDVDYVSNQYVALVNIAPGVRAATTLPPFLNVWSSTQQLAASAETAVAIPPNVGAVGFRLSVSASGSAGAQITMADSVGNAYDQYSVNPGENSIFVPIAPGSTMVVIKNSDSANPINISGQWAIDG
jgi:hypothetical protein